MQDEFDLSSLGDVLDELANGSIATTEIHKVPATIRSRCQQYNFQLHSMGDIMEKLKEAAAESGVTIDSESLVWIAKESTGSLRDAYTLFDQTASLSESKITIKKIRDKLGLVGVDEMTGLIRLLAEDRTKEALEAVNAILLKGIAEEQVLSGLADYYRNILLLKNGITKESILGMTKESLPAGVVNTYTTGQTEKALELILDLLKNFRFSLNRHFELELLIHRLSRMKSFITQEELLKRIERLKKDLGDPGRAPEAGVEAEEPADPETDEQGPTEGLSGGQLIERIKEKIGRQKLTLSSALAKHRSVEYQNNELLIIFNEEDKFLAELVGKDKAELGQLAAQITGTPVTVKVVYAQRKEQPQVQQDESEMIIKKVFKGSVIKGE